MELKWEGPEQRSQTPVTPVRACTNLVAWFWVVLEGGLSLSCLRAGCVWTEVQHAPETREEGRSVKLKESTTVRTHLNMRRRPG